MSDLAEPVCRFPKVHGSHGVTALLHVESRKEIWSLGRDGMKRVWEISADQQMLISSHAEPVGPSFEWPAKFVTVGKQHWIAGFKAVRLPSCCDYKRHTERE